MMGGIFVNVGLFVNVRDLVKLMYLYMNNGWAVGEQLIDFVFVVEFICCQYCDEGNCWGLGFDKFMIEYDLIWSYVAVFVSFLSFGYSGYIGIFIWVDLESGFLLVFLFNWVYFIWENWKFYELNIWLCLYEVFYQVILED